MDKVAQAFAQAIEAEVFSGAQVLYGRGEELLYQGAFGRVREDPDSRLVTEHSLFDIASLTKPLATAALFMRAFQEEKLDMAAPVASWLPDFQRVEPLTLRHLLAHDSGLPAWLPLYEEARGKGWSYDRLREFYTRRIAATPLLAPPGERRIYSDLGFILLGFVLERMAGLRLERLFQEKIAAPLGLAQCLFHPLHHVDRISPQDIAATELCPWRGKLVWGEVHDDNAFVLGGVAGHAGLFASAREVGRFAREILAARTGESGLFARETVEFFLGDAVFPKLGWDTVSPQGSQAGSAFPLRHSVGHLAFTGCSLWLDFAAGKYVVLLSNRVHPRRDNQAIQEFRPRIHDLLLGEGFEG